MPKLNPSHERYLKGVISRSPNGRFDARITIKGKCRRARFPDKPSAKYWIEGIVRDHDTPNKPLTRQQILDATRAFSMIPEGVTLSSIAANYVSAAKLAPVLNCEAEPINQTIETFALDRARAAGPKTIQAYRRHLGKIADCIGGSASVNVVNHAAIELIASPMTPHSRNDFLKSAAAFFAWCVRRKIVAENPCDGILRAKIPPPPLGILAPAQLRRLLAEAVRSDPALVPYLAIGAFAGIRPNEIMRLTPDVIGAQYIRLDASITKTSDARTVTIRPNLRAWLDAYPFTLPTKDPSSLTRRIRALRKKEWLSHASLSSPNPSPKFLIPWPHDCLRHSFATYAYELTKNTFDIASEMGHQGTGMFFKHYRALAEPGQGAEWFGIMPEKKGNGE